jgi:hypothetical protein
MSASNRRSRVLLQAIATIDVIAGWAIAAKADLPITQIAITGDPAPDGGVFTSFEAPTADRQTNYNTGYTPFY